MLFRTLIQAWLQNTAKAKLRDAVVGAVRQQIDTPPPPPSDAPATCRLGVVFALSIESGCFEDMLQGTVSVRAGGHVLREGGLKGRRVAVILAGPGHANARHAAEVLIDGHHPELVVSAGFSGALTADLKRNDIIIAERLLNTAGGEIAVELPGSLKASLGQPNVHCETLLTVDHVVRLPRDRQALGQRYGAKAVDMEAFDVADVCRRRGVPFSAVRVINDTADETLPADVEYLMSRKTAASQFGAALGAILNRPASAKDMYRLRENALVASLRLAKFLAEIF